MSTVSSSAAMEQSSADDATQMRRGSLSMAWYGLVSAMFFIYVGALVGQLYGTVNAIIGLALTIVTYGAINAYLAKYAGTNQLTVALLSRSLMGRSGAIVATLIFCATAIYYAVFEGIIVATAFQAQFGGSFEVWSLVVVLYSTPLVIGGVRNFLDKLNGALMPIYWLGLITACIWASSKYGYQGSWLTAGGSVTDNGIAAGGPGWLATFGIYMGVWVLMMYTMDFASLSRKNDIKFHATYTFGWVFYVLAFGANALIGIFLVHMIPDTEAAESGIAVGLVKMMGWLGLLVVFVSQTRINTANYALGAQNLQEVGKRLGLRLPYPVFVVVSSVIIYILMISGGFLAHLYQALLIQGIVVTAWVAVAVVHIALERARGIAPLGGSLPESAFPAVNLAGLVAWAVGVGVGLALFFSDLAWKGTWGAIITAVVAAAVYAGLASMSFKTLAGVRS